MGCTAAGLLLNLRFFVSQRFYVFKWTEQERDRKVEGKSRGNGIRTQTCVPNESATCHKHATCCISALNPNRRNVHTKLSNFCRSPAMERLKSTDLSYRICINQVVCSSLLVVSYRYETFIPLPMFQMFIYLYIRHKTLSSAQIKCMQRLTEAEQERFINVRHVFSCMREVC